MSSTAEAATPHDCRWAIASHFVRFPAASSAGMSQYPDVEVVAPTDTPRLTLTTCHPKGSARERLVLHADLVGTPLLEDNGVTLKRYFREQDRIRLQPANAEMEPIYATDVQIQGKVVGVIRRLS